MSEVPHPPWCDRQNCQKRGAHTSWPRRIAPPGDYVIPTVIECWLDKPLRPPDRMTLVVLRWSEGRGGQVYSIPVPQARILAWSLRQLLVLSRQRAPHKS
jgi:hypothetical protein